MSKARAKGTAGENFFLPKLRDLFFPLYDGPEDEHPIQRLDMVARHLRASDGDYVGVPWMHEAKNTNKPLFQQWARTCESKRGDDWSLLWKGDMRHGPGHGPYVLMPWDKYAEIIKGRCF